MKGVSQSDNDRNCQNCISRNTKFTEGWFIQAAFVVPQMAPDRCLSAVLPYEHGLCLLLLLSPSACIPETALWCCHPWLCHFHPQLLHVGHDDDAVNKCTTEPQPAHYVWTSVCHPPLSSQWCSAKHTCWFQFLPEVSFFLLWDQTEMNLCCAGKAVAVWEVTGRMASAVFSTSVAR